MERIDAAPCFDCGHSPSELEHFAQGQHKYHTFNVFGQDIDLCNFCDADFGSYDPDYFGLAGEFPRDYDLKLVRRIFDPKVQPDFYCHSCRHRLAFLKFLKNAREANENAA